MGGALKVAVLAADRDDVDSELTAFFESCPTSFAQQTAAWRNVISGLGEDEPLFLGCREGDRLVGLLPACGSDVTQRKMSFCGDYRCDCRSRGKREFRYQIG